MVFKVYQLLLTQPEIYFGDQRTHLVSSVAKLFFSSSVSVHSCNSLHTPDERIFICVISLLLTFFFPVCKFSIASLFSYQMAHGDRQLSHHGQKGNVL